MNLSNFSKQYLGILIIITLVFSTMSVSGYELDQRYLNQNGNTTLYSFEGSVLIVTMINLELCANCEVQISYSRDISRNTENNTLLMYDPSTTQQELQFFVDTANKFEPGMPETAYVGADKYSEFSQHVRLDYAGLDHAVTIVFDEVGKEYKRYTDIATYDQLYSDIVTIKNRPETSSPESPGSGPISEESVIGKLLQSPVFLIVLVSVILILTYLRTTRNGKQVIKQKKESEDRMKKKMIKIQKESLKDL